MNNPQVGGVYPVKDREGLSFRVLAFDDVDVEIIHVRAGQEFGAVTVSRHYFKDVTFPGDRGPIPELVEALEFLVRVDHDSADYDDAIALALRALAKVKTNAVPDSEEVAA